MDAWFASFGQHSTAVMAEIQRYRSRMAKRDTKSLRHTIQVDFYPYQDVLTKTTRRGRAWPKEPLNPIM